MSRHFQALCSGSSYDRACSRLLSALGISVIWTSPVCGSHPCRTCPALYYPVLDRWKSAAPVYAWENFRVWGSIRSSSLCITDRTSYGGGRDDNVYPDTCHQLYAVCAEQRRRNTSFPQPQFQRNIGKPSAVFAIQGKTLTQSARKTWFYAKKLCILYLLCYNSMDRRVIPK